MKKKILIFTAITGHTSLAKAAKSFLDDLPNTEIKIVNLMEDKLTWGFYRISYRFMPFLTKIPYEISKNKGILEIIKNYFVTKYRKKILNILKKEKPDVVITTYFGYIPILDEIKPISKFHFINIISDPVTIHPLIFSREADYNIGFGKYCLKIGKKLGIKNILPTGWLVRKQFFDKVNKEKIIKKYKLDKKITILICGGSEGSNAIILLLPFLFFTKMKNDFQIIFICGKNKALEKIINQIYNFAKTINSNTPKIIVRGFTDNLNEFMSVSDIVIGKAGPNLIFESVSMEKPFIAITHISGQEDGNLELIKKLKLGWVAEDPITAGNIIKKIIENPKILEKFKHLEKISLNNFETGKKLKEIVKNYF
ncbi:MAG: glycosyltransferase [Candidatus Aenigmatarchaeota archaeon]